jgi:hypothetical protein
MKDPSFIPEPCVKKALQRSLPTFYYQGEDPSLVQGCAELRKN